MLINLKIGSEAFLFAERQQPHSIYYMKKVQYTKLNETIEKNFIASFLKIGFYIFSICKSNENIQVNKIKKTPCIYGNFLIIYLYYLDIQIIAFYNNIQWKFHLHANIP